MTGRELASGGTWLDLDEPSPSELAALARRCGAEPALLAPSPRGPRPELREAGEWTLVRLAGPSAAGDADGLAEVRCLLSEDLVVTVRDGAAAVPDGRAGSPAGVLLAVVDALVTGLVGRVGDLGAEVEGLEEGGAGDLGAARRRLLPLRRVVLLQSDVLGRLADGEGLPGGGDRELRRRLRGSAARMGEVGRELEALREALHDATADRQNEVVKRLTAIAVVFVPITFLTGFFGQNFPWLVEHVGGLGAFVGLGLALPAAAVALLVGLGRRRGWL